MFSSVVSLPDEMILQYMNEEKGACVERLKSVTESALSQANWIRTSKIETLQALAIFLVGVFPPARTLHFFLCPTST